MQKENDALWHRVFVEPEKEITWFQNIRPCALKVKRVLQTQLAAWEMKEAGKKEPKKFLSGMIELGKISKEIFPERIRERLEEIRMQEIETPENFQLTQPVYDKAMRKMKG